MAASARIAAMKVEPRAAKPAHSKPFNMTRRIKMAPTKTSNPAVSRRLPVVW